MGGFGRITCYLSVCAVLGSWAGRASLCRVPAMPRLGVADACSSMVAEVTPHPARDGW